jgi:hypothetical protein
VGGPGIKLVRASLARYLPSLGLTVAGRVAMCVLVDSSV